MRLFPVGIVSAAVVTAGALLLRYACLRRGEGRVLALPARVREAAEASLVDRLRERGI